MEEADNLVTAATVTRKPEDFRLPISKQNKLKKDIMKERAESLKKNLAGLNKWKTLKKKTSDDNKVPTRIIANGQDIQSP